MFLNQEEPVSTVRDVADHRAMAFDMDCNCLPVTVGWNVADGDVTVLVKFDAHWANGSFDEVFTRKDPVEPLKSLDQADGSVATHSQISNVVEEDHPGNFVS